MMTRAEIFQQKIILFDGVCNLCNGSVIFVLEHERAHEFRFAAVQSKTGRELLKACGLSETYNQAVIYIENGQSYLGSTAALKIGQELNFPWSMLSAMGFIVPKVIRDWVYSQIAKYRYQWFGRQDVCMVPTKELSARFYE